MATDTIGGGVGASKAVFRAFEHRVLDDAPPAVVGATFEDVSSSTLTFTLPSVRVGDRIAAELAALTFASSASLYGRLAVYKDGALVFGSGDESTGDTPWTCPALTDTYLRGARVWYVAQAGHIAGDGTLTLRLQARLSASGAGTARTFAMPFAMTTVNFG